MRRHPTSLIQPHSPQVPHPEVAEFAQPQNETHKRLIKKQKTNAQKRALGLVVRPRAPSLRVALRCSRCAEPLYAGKHGRNLPDMRQRVEKAPVPQLPDRRDLMPVRHALLRLSAP